MRYMLAVVSMLAMALWLAPEAEAGKQRRGGRRAAPDTVKVKIAWSMGSDRRGEMGIHACSSPRRNTQSTGACFERDVVDEWLIDFRGTTTLRLKEGREYGVCFVGDDLLGRPGRWGVCKILPAVEDATYRFSEGELTYWGGADLGD